MDYDVKTAYEYLIGVDGGGTGTRVCIACADGAEFARGGAGPSALSQGVERAWPVILQALDAACAAAGMPRPQLDSIAAAIGMAGVHNKQWAAAFSQMNPGFKALIVETDAYTTLLGAHKGKPGAIIATGTGSVGEALLTDGTRREVGGWGFPSSDEASGAWLGLHAVNYVQRVIDGRDPTSDFASAVIDHCGGDRDGIFNWLARANQNSYAQLAPIVVEHAVNDPVARSIMLDAGNEVAKIAMALDPSEQLPIALCGGLSGALRPYLPGRLAARIVSPQSDSAAGALHLIHMHLNREQSCLAN